MKGFAVRPAQVLVTASPPRWPHKGVCHKRLYTNSDVTLLLFGCDSSKRLGDEFVAEFSGVWRAGN